MNGLWTEPLGRPAGRRMRLRNVAEEDMRAVLEGGSAHHLSWPADEGGTCYIGRVGERELKVWTMPHRLGERPVTVKSVAWRDEEDER